jgi:hypothetical protein
MRRIVAACLIAMSLATMGGMLAGAPAQAQWWTSTRCRRSRAMTPAASSPIRSRCRPMPANSAVDHCARYGKVVKFLGVQPNYGGYVSFACRWVPYGAAERPLRTLY